MECFQWLYACKGGNTRYKVSLRKLHWLDKLWNLWGDGSVLTWEPVEK